MEERKCIECGEIIPDNMSECPNCGCPVELSGDANKLEVNNIEQDDIEKNIFENPKDNKCGKKTKMRMIFTSIALVIGIITVLMGFKIVSHDVDAKIHKTNMYDVGYSAFGGDFYTEIYKASDTIVDELNSINNGMFTITNSMKSTIKVIYYCSGMIIIAIGLGITAFSLIEMGKQLKN